MSECKAFGDVKQAPTLEEMQESLNVILSKFQDSMYKSDYFSSKIDSLMDSNKQATAKMSSLSDEISRISKNLYDLKSFTKEVAIDCGNKILSLHGKHVDNEESISKLTIGHNGVCEQYHKFYQDFIEFKQDMEKFSTFKADLSNLREYVNSSISDIRVSSVSHDHNIAAIRVKHSSLDSKFTDLANTSISHNSIITDIQDQLCKIRKEHSSSVDANFAYVNGLNNQLKDLIATKVASIKVPDVSNFAMKDEISAAKTSFERMSLDANNANLRSTNNEAKILIMEKKIEQLQLLLNRYELQG